MTVNETYKNEVIENYKQQKSFRCSVEMGKINFWI